MRNWLRGTVRETSYRLGARRQRRHIQAQLPSVSMAPGDVALFAVVNDEALRLPYFFEYYRAMGIAHFFFLDHQSTDDTRAILDRNGAVTISVEGDFIYKDVWLDAVMTAYGNGRWCLVVDADELIVFPGSDGLKLPDLCAYLDTEGASALRCRLLDMFPETGLTQASYRPGESLFDAAPMFDPDLVTRQRLFNVDPCLEKRPLIRFAAGQTQLSAGQHWVKGAVESAVTGTLLHFKFLNDFMGQRTLKRAEAARPSADRDPWYARETAVYADKVKAGADLHLASPTAVRYEGPSQLVDLQIMATSTAFDAWRARRADTPVRPAPEGQPVEG